MTRDNWAALLIYWATITVFGAFGWWMLWAEAWDDYYREPGMLPEPVFQVWWLVAAGYWIALGAAFGVLAWRRER